MIRANIAIAKVTADKPAFVKLKAQPLTLFVRGRVVTPEGVPISNAEIECDSGRLERRL